MLIDTKPLEIYIKLDKLEEIITGHDNGADHLKVAQRIEDYTKAGLL